MAAVIMVTDDLIFASRVAGASEAGGLECRTVKSERALRDALAGQDVRLVIVDLGLDPAVLDACTAVLAELAGPARIAYYPHVRVDLRKRATSLGIDEVMPRSKFAQELCSIIGRCGGR
ncbi:MAG: hypothetical protein C4547_09360 [Phycisphaerales bacterium]|nr:MAG: hypothetical protein C4547_09360 [Phycisphaerales bacterium]